MLGCAAAGGFTASAGRGAAVEWTTTAGFATSAGFEAAGRTFSDELSLVVTGPNSRIAVGAGAVVLVSPRRIRMGLAALDALPESGARISAVVFGASEFGSGGSLTSESGSAMKEVFDSGIFISGASAIGIGRTCAKRARGVSAKMENADADGCTAADFVLESAIDFWTA
jgi:hypothetical protein